MQANYSYAYIRESYFGNFLMSGDNQYVSQPLKFYSEEMTETKRIAIAHIEKKLFPVANSVIYLDQKRNESRVTEAA